MHRDIRYEGVANQGMADKICEEEVHEPLGGI